MDADRERQDLDDGLCAAEDCTRDCALAFTPAGVALPYTKDARLRILGVLLPERSPPLPDVPTMIESGYPNFEVSAWFGVAAPKGIPEAVSQRLQGSLEKIVARKEMVEAFSRLGATVTYKNAQQSAQFMKTDTDRWRKVIDSAKIQMD